MRRRHAGRCPLPMLLLLLWMGAGAHWRWRRGPARQLPCGRCLRGLRLRDEEAGGPVVGDKAICQEGSDGEEGRCLCCLTLAAGVAAGKGTRGGVGVGHEGANGRELGGAAEAPAVIVRGDVRGGEEGGLTCTSVSGLGG